MVLSAFYPQSTFYTLSAFYHWSAVCSLQSAVRSPQSAVYVLHCPLAQTLTDKTFTLSSKSTKNQPENKNLKWAQYYISKIRFSNHLRAKSLVPGATRHCCSTALLSVKLSLMATWTKAVWSKWAWIFFSICSTQIETPDGTILVDYSKNIITEETMKHLMNLVCFKWLSFKHFIQIKRWQRSLFSIFW